MSESIYGVDQFYSGDLAQILIGVYKGDGKQRPLGIPTVKDRIVQQAVKLIIEPIFEADFKDFSYAYRPNRSAKDASEEIRKQLNYGRTNVIDIDIKGFFDHINHEKMTFFVSRRIADPYILKLIREWKRAGIVFEGETTYPMEGTPQGGVISPLLANIYLNELDTLWARRKMHDRYGENARRKMHDRYGENAHLIRYSDDTVILTDRNPEHAMDILKRIISLLDLELNMEKTRITTAQEGFDFLGVHFVRKWSRHKNKEATYVYPSEKAVENFRENIKATIPKNYAFRKPVAMAVKQVNAIIRGWYKYYKHTNARSIFARLERYIDWKLAKYYCFIHKIPRVSSRKDIYYKVRDYGIETMNCGIKYVRNA